jgi:hypothetical protein
MFTALIRGDVYIIHRECSIATQIIHIFVDGCSTGVVKSSRMSKSRLKRRPKMRKQISISKDVLPVGLAMASADSRSFSSFLEMLIRKEESLRNSLKEAA